MSIDNLKTILKKLESDTASHLEGTLKNSLCEISEEICEHKFTVNYIQSKTDELIKAIGNCIRNESSNTQGEIWRTIAFLRQIGFIVQQRVDQLKNNRIYLKTLLHCSQQIKNQN